MLAIKIIVLIIILLLIFISSIFSFAEMAFASTNKIRIKLFLKSPNEKVAKRAKRVLFLRERFNQTSTSIVIVNNVINIIATTLSAGFFSVLLPDSQIGLLISTITMTILIIVFGEIIPKLLAKKFPEKGILIFSFTLLIVYKILYPISKLIVLAVPTETDVLFQSEEELQEALSESNKTGVIDGSENRIIKNTLQFDKKKVKDIMKEIKDVFWLPFDISEQEFNEVIVKNGYSRVPVLDKNKEVMGVFNIKEYLSNKISQNNLNFREIFQKTIKESFFVTKEEIIRNVFEKFRVEKKGLAIVVENENSRKMIGIITLEDLIEEIVGEIYDESDIETNGVYEIGVGSIEVSSWSDANFIFSKYFQNLKNKPEILENETFQNWIFRRFKSKDISNEEFLKEVNYLHYENLLIWIKQNESKEFIFEIDQID